MPFMRVLFVLEILAFTASEVNASPFQDADQLEWVAIMAPAPTSNVKYVYRVFQIQAGGPTISSSWGLQPMQIRFVQSVARKMSDALWCVTDDASAIGITSLAIRWGGEVSSLHIPQDAGFRTEGCGGLAVDVSGFRIKVEQVYASYYAPNNPP